MTGPTQTSRDNGAATSMISDPVAATSMFGFGHNADLDARSPGLFKAGLLGAGRESRDPYLYLVSFVDSEFTVYSLKMFLDRAH